MAFGRGLNRSRVLIPAALLGMIFMRLIWMQLRTYAFSQDSRAIVALEFLHEHLDDSCRYMHFFPQGAPLGAKGAVRANQRQLAEGRQNLTRAWLTSVGYAVDGWMRCHQDLLDDRPVTRLNQWVLMGTMVLAALMVRFITSNWPVTLAVSAMLLSRGRMLADLGAVSMNGMMALFITAWLAAAAHFVRTGATISLVAMGATVAILSVYDRTMIALCLAPVLLLGLGYLWRRQLARPVIRRYRGARQRQKRLATPTPGLVANDGGSPLARMAITLRWMAGLEFPVVASAEGTMDYARGGLFRTIAAPFLLWVYSRRRWVKLSATWLLVALLLTVLSLMLWGWVGAAMTGGSWAEVFSKTAALFAAALRHGLGRSWLADWLAAVASRFDLHLWLSLAVMAACAVQSPAAGLAGFLELTWLAACGLVLALIAVVAADALDSAMVLSLGQDHLATALMLDLRPRAVVAWFEPAILSLGAAGIYNLMKVLDTRFADKT